MYQLILHHVYRGGPYAIDLSGAQNDGLVIDALYAKDGATAGSGALVFRTPHSRVRVPLRNKSLFKRLFALKVEVTVRMDALGQRRNLVEGDNSFAFFIDPQGHLCGSYNGPQFAGGPLVWQGANSLDNSPDGTTRTVPMNHWVTLRFEHDGYASVRLFIDDVLVAANYSLRSGVPPVVNTGVSIGNWTLTDAYAFDGAIDEVKIWRWDPDEAFGQFLGRPAQPCGACCWQAIFEWIEAQLHDPHGRQRVIALMGCIGAAQTEMVRALRSKGEKAIAKNARLSAEYRQLWQRGAIDGDDMKDWQVRWFDWVTRVAGPDAFNEYTERVQRCLIASGFLDQLPHFDCDDEFARYIQSLSRTVGRPMTDIGDCNTKETRDGSHRPATN